MLLEVKNLNKKFGSVTAANNINFKMNKNEIIGVIGANGAGKTTFCNIITGYTLREPKLGPKLGPKLEPKLGAKTWWDQI